MLEAMLGHSGRADLSRLAVPSPRTPVLIPGLKPEDADKLNLPEVLAKGIGNQVALTIYDAPPTFDFNVPGFLGMMIGSFNGHGNAIGTEGLLVSFLASSFQRWLSRTLTPETGVVGQGRDRK